MASVEKYAISAVRNQLRHLDREVKNSSNPDIDRKRSALNYKLSPERKSDYLYFKKRKSELFCMNRADVKVLAGWITTAPKELHPEHHARFFRSTYDFLCDRYGGEQNVVSAVVHMDESGQPHMHFLFIPVAPDTNEKHWQTEKVCAFEVLTRKELQNFHPDWGRYLREHGVYANVQSGITLTQGGNRTVKEMKLAREREYQWQKKREHQHEHQHERELYF